MQEREGGRKRGKKGGHKRGKGEGAREGRREATREGGFEYGKSHCSRIKTIDRMYIS